MELIMQNMDLKRAAIEALRKKIAKLELEADMGDEVNAGDDLDVGSEERGLENMAEGARAEAEADAATEGEDGEKGVSIEMEMESEDPEAAKGMEELYKRMAEEFSGMPESRKAAGMKRGKLAGIGGGLEAVLKGKSKK